MIAGELEVDWPATIARIACPTLLVRATEPFGPPGSPPILASAAARRTLALLADGRLAEIRGNHITFLFGDRARAVVEQIVSFA